MVMIIQSQVWAQENLQSKWLLAYNILLPILPVNHRLISRMKEFCAQNRILSSNYEYTDHIQHRSISDLSQQLKLCWYRHQKLTRNSFWQVFFLLLSLCSLTALSYLRTTFLTVLQRCSRWRHVFIHNKCVLNNHQLPSSISDLRSHGGLLCKNQNSKKG